MKRNPQELYIELTKGIPAQRDRAIREALVLAMQGKDPTPYIKYLDGLAWTERRLAISAAEQYKDIGRIAWDPEYKPAPLSDIILKINESDSKTQSEGVDLEVVAA